MTPKIIIKWDVKSRGSSLNIKGPFLKQLSLQGYLSTSQLGEFHKDLRESLKKVRAKVGGDLTVLSWDNISDAVRELVTIGRRLAYQLWGDTETEKIQNYCRTVHPKWEASELSPIFVEARCSIDSVVPIDLLPLFDFSDPPPIGDIATLARVAQRFLGFSAIVNQTIDRVSMSRDMFLDDMPRLPVKLFYNARLEGARAEARFFRERDHDVDLEGPWPCEATETGQFVDTIAKHLRNARPRFDGSDRDGSDRKLDQIQHFACHFNANPQPAFNHFLTLAHDGQSAPELRVTVAELQDRFMSLGASEPESSHKSKPVVFMNACGSADLDPTQPASFARFILLNRNRGFIGVQTSIPDKVAPEFSAQFYTALLSGKRLGQAAHQAKWTLLRRYRNPLGILYTTYANPEIRLSQRSRRCDQT